MKKILLTLARWFHVDLTEIKYVEVIKEVEVPVERIVEKQIAFEGTVEGDVTVIGNLVVEGSLDVSGGVSCLSLTALTTAAANNIKLKERRRNAKGQFVKEE